MQTRRVALGAALLLTLGACGIEGDGVPGQDVIGLEIPTQVDSCTTAEIDFAAPGSSQQCSGPWVYDKGCCNTGNTLTTCQHSHTVGNWTTTVPAQPNGTTVCVAGECLREGWECIDTGVLISSPGMSLRPKGDCIWTCVEWEEICGPGYYPCTATTPAVVQKLDAIKTTWSTCKLDPAKGIKPVPALVSVSGYYGTCTATYSGVPYAEPAVAGGAAVPNACDNKVDAAVCGTATFAACTAATGTNPDGTAKTFAPPGNCSFPEKVVTAKNLTRAALDALTDKPISAPGYAPPFCTTCENESSAASPTTGQVDAKLACLIDRSLTEAKAWAAVAGHTSYVDEVVQHAMLEYEFYGDRASSDAYRAKARQVYDENPTKSPVCGVDARFTPVTSSQGCSAPALGLAAGALLRCDRLTSPHSAQPLAAAEAPGCVDAVSRITVLAPACTARQTYLDGGGDAKAYTDVSAAILSKAFKSFSATGADVKPELQRRLALVDRWYRAVSDPDAAGGAFEAYAGSTAADRKWRDTGFVTSALWKSFLAPDLSTFTSSFRTEQDISSFLTNGMARDRDMLDALFGTYLPPGTTTGTPPLRTAPALFVLSDALQTLTERLEQMAAFHDMGCRFKDCVTLQPKTEALALQGIVGALANGPDPLAGNAAELPLAISNGAAWRADPIKGLYFSTNWDTWRPTFDRIRDGHAEVIQRSLKSAKGTASSTAYDPAWIWAATPGDPLPLVNIGSLVRRARAHVANYREAGLFLSEGARSLPLGLLGSKIDLVSSQVENAKANFTTYRNAFVGHRDELVARLLSDLGAGATKNGLLNRFELVNKRLRELAEDETGLNLSSMLEQARFGSAAKILEDVAAVTDAAGTRYVQAKVLSDIPIHLEIAGSNARAPRSGWGVISGAAVEQTFMGVKSVWKLPVQPGQIVTFSLGSGTYAPTCALNDTFGSGYLGLEVWPSRSTSSLRDSQTGPGGFNLSYSTNRFVADSSSSSFEFSRYVSAEACLKYQSGGGVLGIAAMSFEAKACAGFSLTWADTSTDTSGNEQRSTASFTQGVRLRSTPFPTLPAGALVAVLMPSGRVDRNELVDMRVLQAPVTSIAITQASTANPNVDLYLVVNDYACGQAGAGTIAADVTVVEPVAARMTQMVNAMQTALTSLKNQANAIVAQGRLLPSQMRDFKNQAWTEVQRNCGCDPGTYPPAIYNYFDQWLDTQVLSIERRVERTAIMREMAALSLEADSLARDIGTATAQSRLQEMLPQWSLKSLTLGNEDMRAAAAEMAMLTSKYLYPMAHLRYPEALSSLAAPDELLKLDWAAASPDALDQKVRALVDEFRPRLESAVIASKVDDGTGNLKLPTAIAAVRFKRPESALVWPVSSHGRTITDSRAAELWATLRDNHERAAQVPPLPPNPVNFRIELEDLYQRGTVNTLLGCSNTQPSAMAPVVKRMGFYITTLSEDFDPPSYNGDIRVPSHGPREMLFPVPGGLEFFTFDPEVVTGSMVPLRYATPAAVLDEFKTPPYLGIYSLAQQGISPFGAWQLDLDAAEGYPFGDLGDEFVVIMELETRMTAPLLGVETCMP